MLLNSHEDKDNKRIMTLVKFIRPAVILIMVAAMFIVGFTWMHVYFLSKFRFTWLLNQDENECYLHLPSSHYMLRLISDEGEPMPEYDIMVEEVGNPGNDIDFSEFSGEHTFTFRAYSSHQIRISVSWTDERRPWETVRLQLRPMW